MQTVVDGLETINERIDTLETKVNRLGFSGIDTSGPKQSFVGFMLYNRFWFDKDRYGVTIGGGKINNPGRYLVLIPPINGASFTKSYLP